ncbi:unnamed protein product [Darwinula stevensoni]|uniref:BRCT domain-containing protein n=1 Tax=Darwinula stevensoni TaxID=69355 RepID=A0A7R9ABT3_9CRUS|nr:unnamed protein product [Darwinula stevensoni]CAG0899707.1 unnamed protein product [Darwinula stevensoni]
MAPLNIQKIVSLSSEDPNFPAENLLKSDSFKKWRCKEPGEKQASVILQLDKSSQIHAIDIGNENSAFIEVQVGHSDSSADGYQVILVTSSFMTPAESRNGTNPNRVRMFGREKLSESVACQKWDRVKIVCSQPFNKHCQYGLSFVKIHGPPEEESTSRGQEGKMGEVKKIGAFKLNPVEKDAISIGSLFSRMKAKKEQPSTSTAAAIRDASSLAEVALARRDKEDTIPKLNKNSETTKNGEDKQLSHHSSAKEKRGRESSPGQRNGSSLASIQRGESNATSKKAKKHSLEADETKPSSSKKSKPDQRKKVTRPFNKLMEDVVFVISGIQNPLRAEIRQKATEMGAKYKPDWGRGCTHLVCAFLNTPKYNQVKGKGKIMKKEWIEDVYNKRCRFPWKRYALIGPDEDLSDESEPEVYAAESDEEEMDSDPYRPSVSESSKEEGQRKKHIETNVDPYDQETDDEAVNTDDELERVQKEQDKKLEKKKAMKDEEDPYGADTDTEEEKKEAVKDEDPYGADTDTEEMEQKEDVSNLDWPPLPNFFKGKVFSLLGKIDGDLEKRVKRYIIAYGGKLEPQFTKNALKVKKDIDFVKPEWILQCHSKQRVVDHQPYVIEQEEDETMVVFRPDPCGIICLFVTYAAVFYADYVIMRWVVLDTMANSLWGTFNALLFNTLAFLAIMSHVRAVFSDPGVVPLPKSKVDFSDLHSGGDQQKQMREDWTVCVRCETYRPPRAHHCRICRRCVRRMDHHCPWINNCVGEWNQKYFIQFLIWIGLLALHALILIILSLAYPCEACEKEPMVVKQSRVIHSVILVLESLLFGMFVIAIMVDQFSAIMSDETAVEQVQKAGPYRPRKPAMALLSEVAAEEEPDKLYKMVEVEVQGHDPAVLRSYETYSLMAAKHLNIPVKQTFEKHYHHYQRNVLKSIHIFKKHQVHYEVRTYYRVLQFQHLTGSTADTFLEYIQRNLPEGVMMKHAVEKLPEHISQAPS